MKHKGSKRPGTKGTKQEWFGEWKKKQSHNFDSFLSVILQWKVSDSLCYFRFCFCVQEQSGGFHLLIIMIFNKKEKEKRTLLCFTLRSRVAYIKLGAWLCPGRKRAQWRGCYIWRNETSTCMCIIFRLSYADSIFPFIHSTQIDLMASKQKRKSFLFAEKK